MLQTVSAAPVLARQESNPAAVYLAALAPSGRRAMRSRLESVATILGFDTAVAVPWAALRYEHLAAVRAKLTESGKAPATVNMSLAAVRGVMRAAFNMGQVEAEDYQRLRNVAAVRGETLPKGRCLSIGEIGALLDVCDKTPIGCRDAAIVALMFAGGLRRAEVIALDVEHYSTETGELRITGKGNKERLLYVSNGAAAALSDWLAVRGDSDGPLFVPARRGGSLQMRRMTAQAVYNLLRNRANMAGVAAFSPHDLRRSFVSTLLDKGADITTVQRLAGHANVQTTARYDRRGEEAKKQAIQLLHVPYKRT